MRVDVRAAVDAAAELKGRAFEGSYAGRRLVPTSEYRDEISVAASERELRDEFAALRERLERADATLFCGCERDRVWTALPEGTPLGHHWFQVRGATLRGDELAFRVVSLRHFPERDAADERGATVAAAEREPTVGGDRAELNPLEALRVASTVVAAVLVGAFEVVRFVGEFTLRFVREASIFVEKSTPVVRVVLDFCARLSSATLALVATLFRGDRPIRVERRPPIEPRYDDRPRRWELD